MNPYLKSITNAVSAGETDSQYAVKNGTYIGDLFFITDQNHKVIVALMWTGVCWITENTIMEIEK